MNNHAVMSFNLIRGILLIAGLKQDIKIKGAELISTSHSLRLVKSI